MHARNPAPRPGETHPFQTWEEIDAICAEMDLIGGPLVVFLVGTGARPEEAFGTEWSDIDLGRGCHGARRAFAEAA